MKNKKTLIIAGLAIAVLGTVALASPALANGPRGFFGGADRGEGLADALGISVDELQAAQDLAFENGVADAVESGRLDEERAELMIAGRRLQRSIDQEAIMAEVLGVSAEDLKSAQADGTMRELHESLELDRGTMHERMQAAQEAAVAAAVQDGVITAEQAEALQGAKGQRGFGRTGCNKGGHGGFKGHGDSFEGRGDASIQGRSGFRRGFRRAPGFTQPAPVVDSSNL